MKGTHICQTCGQTGYPKTVTSGSIAIEIILWLVFLVPGIIYSIWRLTTRHKACRYCGSAALVPIDSPRGREILAGRSEGAQTRSCPQCGEEIRKAAKLCKHCGSSVQPIYVDDPEANRHIIMIGKLVDDGLSSAQIAQELQDQQIPCLMSGKEWDATFVQGLISKFALT